MAQRGKPGSSSPDAAGAGRIRAQLVHELLALWAIRVGVTPPHLHSLLAQWYDLHEYGPVRAALEEAFAAEHLDADGKIRAVTHKLRGVKPKPDR